MPQLPRQLEHQEQDQDERPKADVGLEDAPCDARPELSRGHVRDTLRLVCHGKEPSFDWDWEEPSDRPKVVAKFKARRTPGAERLRRALADSGLTQEDAAALVGTTGRQLRKWLSTSPVAALDLLVLLEARAKKQTAHAPSRRSFFAALTPSVVPPQSIDRASLQPCVTSSGADCVCGASVGHRGIEARLTEHQEAA